MMEDEDEVALQYDVQNDVEDEQELQSLDNWETISQINPHEVMGLVVDESLEAIISENSREVALGTDKDYRRCVRIFLLNSTTNSDRLFNIYSVSC